ncbi:MAG: penicillin-binding protein, partial [Dietzia cercidiphylli]
MTPTTPRRPCPSSARRRPRPVAGLVAAALTVALTGTGCAELTGDTGTDELQQFLSALSSGDLAGAAALTTDPAAAQETLEANVLAMGFTPTLSAGTPDGDRRPDRDPVTVEITWDMGTAGDDEADDNEADDNEADDDEAGSDPAGGTPGTEGAARIVTTTGEARTTRVGEDWKVEWAPTILDTRLEPGGALAFSEILDYDTSVLDRTGEPLLQWTPVTAVTLAPGAVESADAVAALVNPVVPTITGQTIREGMTEAGDQPYQIVALRPSDIDPIREQLAAVPGVSLPEQGQLIRTDRDLDSPALTGLPDAWTEALQEEGGWTAEIVNPDAEPIELGSA